MRGSLAFKTFHQFARPTCHSYSRYSSASKNGCRNVIPECEIQVWELAGVRNASQAVRLHFPDPPRASAHQSKREKQILHTKDQLYCVFGGILLHNSPKISDPGRYHGQSDPIILYSWSAAPPDPTQSQRATKRLPCGSGSTEMRVSGSSSPYSFSELALEKKSVSRKEGGEEESLSS